MNTTMNNLLMKLAKAKAAEEKAVENAEMKRLYKEQIDKNKTVENKTDENKTADQNCVSTGDIAVFIRRLICNRTQTRLCLTAVVDL